VGADGTLLVVILVAVGACAVACAVGIFILVRKHQKATKPAAAGGAEPAGVDATNMYHRMAGWYKGAPESAALRTTWGAYPTTPRALESWSGFVAVTNAFLDSSAGLPAAPGALRFEAADEEEQPPAAESSAMEEHEVVGRTAEEAAAR
jgi:hypothetical protein